MPCNILNVIYTHSRDEGRWVEAYKRTKITFGKIKIFSLQILTLKENKLEIREEEEKMHYL